MHSAAQARAVQSNWETMQRLATVPAVAVALAIVACTLQGCEESTLDSDRHVSSGIVNCGRNGSASWISWQTPLPQACLMCQRWMTSPSRCLSTLEFQCRGGCWRFPTLPVLHSFRMLWKACVFPRSEEHNVKRLRHVNMCSSCPPSS